MAQPMLGTRGDGLIPETVLLDGHCECHQNPASAIIEKDYQWNHNFIREDITTETGSMTKHGAYALGTFTWRTWGPTCSDTICLDTEKMKDGDCAGLSAFNADAGVLTVKKEGNRYTLVMSEESVKLDDHTKAITSHEVKEMESVNILKSQTASIYLRMDADFRPDVIPPTSITVWTARHSCP